MSPPVAALRVLVVEDEDDIRHLIALNLRRAGFEVLTAPDGHTALDLAFVERPPVVLLDLMLPDLSGTEICARLRSDDRTRRTHVIMVTARSEEEDRLTGFEKGADDYVTKPFSVKELVARVKAAARRVTEGVPLAGSTLVRGEIRIDSDAHRVWVAGEEVELTATEFKLLVHLAEQPGRLCSRGELLQEVWEMPPTLHTRTVDTHVKRLRQKLGDAGRWIETVRGAGYRFAEVDPARR